MLLPPKTPGHTSRFAVMNSERINESLKLPPPQEEKNRKKKKNYVSESKWAPEVLFVRSSVESRINRLVLLQSVVA